MTKYNSVFTSPNTTQSSDQVVNVNLSTSITISMISPYIAADLNS